MSEYDGPTYVRFGVPKSTPYGDVTITDNGVTIEATGNQLWEWSHRRGASWPCSTLDDLDSIRAHFDANGLVDLEQSPSEYDESSNMTYPEIAGDEFNAWSCDVLRDVLPIVHPAWFVTVGQFIESER